MEQEIELRKDYTGQLQILMKRYLELLGSNSKYRVTLDYITKQTNKFVKIPIWYSSTFPFIINDINQELVENISIMKIK